MTLPTTDAERKALPIFSYVFTYFPDALLAEVGVAVAGNNQHNPGQPLHWAREKSKDQMNTAMRHIWDYGTGTKKDTDGQWHLAKAIWRLKAQLQLDIEAERMHSCQFKNSEPFRATRNSFDAVAAPDLEACTSISPVLKRRCELAPGHLGDHRGGDFIWHNVR